MILLQAGMAFGMLVMVVAPVAFLAGTFVVAGFIMRTVWRRQGKTKLLEDKVPYYKDLWLYIPVLLFSLIIVIVLYFSLILLIFGGIVFE